MSPELLRGISVSLDPCDGEVTGCRRKSDESECVNLSGVPPELLDCTLGGGGGGVMPLSTP